jgi:ketosteroid isomerase-like protein
MKNVTKTFIVAMVFTLPLAACSQPQSTEPVDGGVKTIIDNTEAMSKDVVSTLNSYAQLINAKDVAAMGGFVLPDGEDFTIFEGKGKNVGWADYRDHHLAPEFDNADLVFTKYEYSNYKTNVSGALATATFTINMAYTYKGNDSEVTRNGTAILKNVNGGWKISHLHTS